MPQSNKSSIVFLKIYSMFRCFIYNDIYTCHLIEKEIEEIKKKDTFKPSN
jgi:hypothetical protein